MQEHKIEVREDLYIYFKPNLTQVVQKQENFVIILSMLFEILYGPSIFSDILNSASAAIFDIVPEPHMGATVPS